MAYEVTGTRVTNLHLAGLAARSKCRTSHFFGALPPKASWVSDRRAKVDGMEIERLMDAAVRQARKHAKTVLSTQEARMAPAWGINSPRRRVQAMARVLQDRIQSATDKGVESAVLWHCKWLNEHWSPGLLHARTEIESWHR